jgi:hypothetical protein
MEGWDNNGCLGDWLGGGGWRGFNWLRKGTDGELLPSGSDATELITSSKSCVCVCVCSTRLDTQGTSTPSTLLESDNSERVQ